MKINTLFFLFILTFTFVGNAQVGIGTTNPKGQLDVYSSNLGIVVPRVSSLDDVTDGNGNRAVDGTVVYDLTTKKICYRIEGSWVCKGKSSTGSIVDEIAYSPIFNTISNYVKASNTESFDYFGGLVYLSANGAYLVVSASNEESNATGINGNQLDNSASDSGAVYVFKRTGALWAQQAYIKASNTESHDGFGYSISLSANGTYLAVGAIYEDSNATGINNDQSDNSTNDSGAVYVFKRTGETWVQKAYIKASNTESFDQFGYSISLSADGVYLAISSNQEESNATGINGNQSDNSANDSGAVYVFKRTVETWAQQAYIKASNTESNDGFGSSISLSTNGTYLAVGAIYEDSNATGINGNQSDNSASVSGAVYIFKRVGNNWAQQAYIKASNTDSGDYFGVSVSISSDGSRLAVGAYGEDSSTKSINGDQSDNSTSDSGAVYIFNRTGNTWTQQAYIKASNSGAFDYFGVRISLSSDGSHLAIAATFEDSNAIGINGNQFDNTEIESGAVYIFSLFNGSIWEQNNYIKASNTENSDTFGTSVSLNVNGSLLVVGANREDSNATGINGDQNNNSAPSSGAAYIIE